MATRTRHIISTRFGTQSILSATQLLITLSLLVFSNAQADNLLSPTNNQLNSALASNINSTNSSLTIGGTVTPNFLPVEQAYQLQATVNGNRLQLHWLIAPGYYLYGHNLSIHIGDRAISIELPQGKARYDDYYEKELQVYYDQLDLNLDITNEATAFTVSVQSQGCADAGLCYPPRTQSLAVNAGATLIAPPSVSVTPPSTSLPAVSQPNSLSLLMALLLACAGGIILNLMPCVFPVLSLKALSLASNSFSLHRQHLHGWAYTAGSVVSFVLIAIILFSVRSAGEAAGWGFQLQSPLMVALLAYLFVLLGLSLSGLSLSGILPTGILGRHGSFANLGENLTHGHTLTASFFTGALASVVASPCTAPFMGAALGWALVQPMASGLLVFAALGFGMALPFLLLSHLPNLSRILPKPGRWMETLKQALAFPMYFTAIWLLWVLGHQSGSDNMALLLGGMTTLGFAAWITQTSTKSKHLITRKALALLALLVALLPLQQIAQPSTERSDWQDYSPTELQRLRAQGEPVFIDLTADWCITCLANEKFALDTASAKAAFTRLGVHRLRGDWTNYNADITALLREHNRSGVPLYLFYPTGVGKPPQLLPQILSEQLVIDTLERGATPY